MSSIVDRTKTNSVIHEINGVPLSRPATVQGGDDFMFLPPRKGRDSVVFANQPAIANRHLQVGRAAEDQFGVPPIFAPHYMAPTGGDFSTGTAETGMAYAFEVLSPQAKKELDKFIREKGFDVTTTTKLPNGKTKTRTINYKKPDWFGIDDPRSVKQLRNAPAELRKGIVNKFGTKNFFESEGFLSPGEMRALVTKPELLNVRDGTFGNFGILNTAGELTPTNHWSYATGFPGEGVSPIIEAGNIGPYNFTDLQKAYAKDASGIPIDTLWNSQGVPRTKAVLDPNNPANDDLTALARNITFSVLDDEQLERMRALGMIGVPGLLAAGTASANDSELKPKTNAGLLAQNYQGDLLGGMDFSKVKGDQRPFLPTVGEMGKFAASGIPYGLLNQFEGYQDLAGTNDQSIIPYRIPDHGYTGMGQIIDDLMPNLKRKYLSKEEAKQSKSFGENVSSFISGILN